MNSKNLLETALDYYDQKATRYFQGVNEYDKETSEDVRERRKIELARAKEYLDKQRIHLNTLASIQSKLDEYREQGRLATQGIRSKRRDVIKELEAEKHHPTAERGGPGFLNNAIVDTLLP